MEARTDEHLRPAERLTKSADYAKVLRRGVRVDGRLFNLAAVPNQKAHHRLGLTVSRRVGGAVERNRAKRLLREAFRRRILPAAAPIHCDLVVVAKREMVDSRQADVDRELQRSLERLESRLRSRGPAGRAQPHPAG